MIDTTDIRAKSPSAGPWVHPEAVIGRGSEISAMAIIEPGAVVGARCVIEPFARICSGAVLGDYVRIGQGSIVGGAPQHLAWSGQPAPCRVGNGSRLGEYVTVHGGMEGATNVGERSFLMAYAHLGHDVSIGDEVVIANGVQLAGHVRVGRGANLGGGTLVHQRVRIGEYAFVAGGIRLELDLAPWSRALGIPARWSRMNRIALERAGWSAQQRVDADEALRIVFRRGLLLSKALDVLASVGTRPASQLLEFCKEDGRGLLRSAH